MKPKYLATVPLFLACAPQQSSVSPVAPPRIEPSCPAGIQDRISCIKKEIDSISDLSEAQTLCEGFPVPVCRLDVLKKFANELEKHESPFDACVTDVEKEGNVERKSVDLSCLMGQVTALSRLQSDIRNDLRECDEEVLSCYEDFYTSLP